MTLYKAPCAVSQSVFSVIWNSAFAILDLFYASFFFFKKKIILYSDKLLVKLFQKVIEADKVSVMLCFFLAIYFDETKTFWILFIYLFSCVFLKQRKAFQKEHSAVKFSLPWNVCVDIFALCWPSFCPFQTVQAYCIQHGSFMYNIDKTMAKNFK